LSLQDLNNDPSDVCTKCAAGRTTCGTVGWTVQRGSWTCVRGTVCSPCELGTADLDSSAATPCVDCHIGFYAAAAVTDCAVCPAGCAVCAPIGLLERILVELSKRISLRGLNLRVEPVRLA